MPSPRTKPSLTSLVAFFLIVTPVVYVLSYAPVAKVCARTHQIGTWRITYADGSLYPAYKPVDWLIDNTPLQKPLFMWAGLWSVHREFEEAASFRKQGYNYDFWSSL